MNEHAFYVESTNRSRSIFNIIGLSPIAIGTIEPPVFQSNCGIAIGILAGNYNQGDCAIAIGEYAGRTSQGADSIAIGTESGKVNQGEQAVSIGTGAGTDSQGVYAICVGSDSGRLIQSDQAIAIGMNAGEYSQGTSSIAIGSYAGRTNQPQHSIVINASGDQFDIDQENALYINPIRNSTGSQLLFYEPSNKEVTYSDLSSAPLTFETYTYNELQGSNTVLGKMMYTDCADKDAFYRLRVSQPITLFEGSTIYNSNPIFFDNDTSGNVTISGPNSSASMTLTINSGSTLNEYAARQSHYYAHYQPGKSFMAMFSFCFGGMVNGIAKRVGLYDVDNSNNNTPLNGILLEQTINGLSWYIYKGDGTSQTASQSNWNIDTLDGLGPSSITINPLNNLLGFVDLEWLGVGRVRVGFFINGVPIICNVFNNIQFTVPYINNPYLPIRYEIRRVQNISTSTTSFTAICCNIMSEGGYEPLGILRSFQSAQLTLSSTNIKYCLALRLKQDSPRSMIQPISIEIVSDLNGGSNIAYYSVYLWRPSSYTIPSSTTWTDMSTSIGGSGSLVEYSNSGQSGVTDLYTQMVNDTQGICVLVERGSVNSISKTSFSNVSDSLLFAQSSVDRRNRDIYLIVIDNNNTGNNHVYTTLFTWKVL